MAAGGSTATPEVAQVATAPDQWASRSSTSWRWLRRAILAGYVVLVLSTLLVGERAASIDRLSGQVAAGAVDEVRVVGTGIPQGSRGFSTLEVHWREGLVGYVAQVVEARPLSEAPPSDEMDDGTVVISGSVVDRLTEREPGLRVVTDPDPEVGFGGSIGAWQLPGWLAWWTLLLGLATLGLLVVGPQPWRSTRWGWSGW